MAIRKPHTNIEVPRLNDIPAIKWHSLACELITPMYGGGVKSTIIDEKMPIRATGIRGQLRFWWRLLAKQAWYSNETPEQIRKKEFELWGSMSVGSDDGKAGLVLLRIRTTDKAIIEPWAEYNLNPRNKQKLSPEDWANVPYALFPAQGKLSEDGSTVEEKPHKLLREGFKWALEIAYLPQTTDEQKEEAWESIRWWAKFGGVGSRTRRGLGAIHVSSEELSQINEEITESEIEAAGCRLVQKQQATPNAMSALNTAISKLSKFRQGENVGRNEGKHHNRPGRSRWPEPDAIRRIKNTHADNHEPEHSAGNIFPRAMFGLPIIYRLVGRSEPNETNLVATEGERLSSPLILRPMCAGNNTQGQRQWKASALLLPYEHIMGMSVTVDGGAYPIWSADVAQHIRPINDNAGGNEEIDPLQAFLNYFAQ